MARGSHKNIAPAEKEEPRSYSPKRSLLAPIGDFARDSILRPKTPFELVPGKDPNGWGFVLEPYGWAMALDGNVGVKGLPHFERGCQRHYAAPESRLGRLCARGSSERPVGTSRGRLLRPELSGSGDLGGRVTHKSGSLNVQRGLVSLALAYRIVDDRRGFLDFYAGARYNYLGVQISTTVDSDGVSAFSDQIVDRLTARIDAKVNQIVSSLAGILASDVETKVKQDLDSRALARIADTPGDVRQLVRDGAIAPGYTAPTAGP